MRRLRAWFPLAGTVLLAGGVRALGWGEVFGPGGEVSLDTHDSAYHARRALYSFVRFPELLRFDPYMAYPGGAWVPMPPLYDWALAAVARIFGDEVATFEWVAAWTGPVLGALTVLPVYGMARLLAGPGAGLAAALLYALLPVAVWNASLGEVDHHPAVALLGALTLLASLRLLGGHPGWRPAAALAALLAALALTWSGSLLYLGLALGALALAGLVDGEPATFWRLAAGAGGAALGVATWLALGAGQGTAVLSTTNLSWLHALVLGGGSLAAAALAGAAPLWRDEGLGTRLGLGAAVAGAVAGLTLVLLPGSGDALGSAVSFVSKTDAWGAHNPEQKPIFALANGRFTAAPALESYGALAFALPLAVLAFLLPLRQAAQRGRAVCGLLWAAVLGSLAVTQVRFGTDFAPVACVGFALLGARAATSAGERRGLAWAGLALLGAALLWPGVARTYLHPAARGISHSKRSLAEFARMLRAATPETSGFLDPAAEPEYGVLARASHGHTLHYFARRATPANNFGPYLDEAKYREVRRFYRVGSEAEAVAIAHRLSTPYVMSFAVERPPEGSFVHALHAGRSRGVEARAQRFRLVVEGPPGGLPLPAVFPSRRVPAGTIPYKLYEVVEGATLEVRGAPGSPVTAELEVRSNLGRRFPVVRQARVGGDGRARLRVPYATRTEHPTRPTGPYRLRVAGRETTVDVRDADVREGLVVRVEPRP